jgi:hypothetical protein
LFIYFGFYFLEPFWEKIKFGRENYYPEEYLKYVIPAYVILWFFFLYLSGAYEKRTRVMDVFKGIALGTVILLLVYALLPESLRYSRALLLMGTIWATISVFLTRITIGPLFNVVAISFSGQKRRIVIVGSSQESNRVLSIMKQAGIEPTLIGLVGSDEAQQKNNLFMGNLSQMNEIVKINRIDEIVFCAKDIPSQKIIQTMLSVSDTAVDFKIAPPESLSIIGSSSINTAGELYVVHFNSLSQSLAKRKKRLFDFMVSVCLLLTFPIIVFTQKKPFRFFRNIILVMTGLRTWVGFFVQNGSELETLPKISKGILTPIPVLKNKNIGIETIRRVNLLYAKDYKISTDLSIIFRDFKYLGR